MKMKNETQALHLAKMMQRHIHIKNYELGLPLAMIPRKKLKKLSVGDVLLTGLNRLEFILIDRDTICANIQLKQFENESKVEITKLTKEPIKQSDSKKYKVLNFFFGTVKSKGLELGSTIDTTHLDIGKVSLVSEGDIIAEGSLVNVDEEIAIQIKKVN